MSPWSERRLYRTKDGTEFVPLDDEAVEDSANFDFDLCPYWQIENMWIPESALLEFVDALRATQPPEEPHE